MATQKQVCNNDSERVSENMEQEVCGLKQQTMESKGIVRALLKDSQDKTSADYG